MLSYERESTKSSVPGLHYMKQATCYSVRNMQTDRTGIFWKIIREANTRCLIDNHINQTFVAHSLAINIHCANEV